MRQHIIITVTGNSIMIQAGGEGKVSPSLDKAVTEWASIYNDKIGLGPTFRGKAALSGGQCPLEFSGALKKILYLRADQRCSKVDFYDFSPFFNFTEKMCIDTLSLIWPTSFENKSIFFVEFCDTKTLFIHALLFDYLIINS